MSVKTQLALSTITAAQLATMSQDALYSVATALFNQINDNVYDDSILKQVVNRQGQTINELLAIKDTLSSLEQGAIEETILNLLKDTKLQDIYSSMKVSVDGTPYSLQSVVSVISNAKVQVDEQVLRDVDSKIIGIKVLWSDASTTDFMLTTTLNDANTERTDTYTGVVDSIEYSKVDKFIIGTKMAGSIPVPTVDVKSIGTIVLDLTSAMSAPIETASDNNIADTDNDGTVGTTAQVTPETSLVNGGQYDKGSSNITLSFANDAVKSYDITIDNGDGTEKTAQNITVADGAVNATVVTTQTLDYVNATTPLLVTIVAKDVNDDVFGTPSIITTTWSGNAV